MSARSLGPVGIARGLIESTPIINYARLYCRYPVVGFERVALLLYERVSFSILQLV